MCALFCVFFLDLNEIQEKTTVKITTKATTTKMLRSPSHIVGHGPTSGGIMGIHTHPSPPTHARSSLFDSCHRKIRLIGGGPVAFIGGLVA